MNIQQYEARRRVMPFSDQIHTARGPYDRCGLRKRGLLRPQPVLQPMAACNMRAGGGTDACHQFRGNAVNLQGQGATRLGKKSTAPSANASSVSSAPSCVSDETITTGQG